MAKIIVFSTVGARKMVFEDVDFTTFDELKNEILEIDDSIDFSKIKALDKDTRNVYENGSLLAPGDRTIFLTASNSDKAAASYKELRAEYKRILASSEGETFKNFISQFGNYTQFTTAKLQEVLSNYDETPKAKTPKTVAPEKKQKEVSSLKEGLSLEERVSRLEETVFSISVDSEPSEEELMMEAARLGLV